MNVAAVADKSVFNILIFICGSSAVFDVPGAVFVFSVSHHIGDIAPVCLPVSSGLLVEVPTFSGLCVCTSVCSVSEWLSKNTGAAAA